MAATGLMPIYRRRNVIERTFCRLKDFRAIATRYDKTARNFLAGLCLVTALCYWINWDPNMIW
jgi:putative transposase